MCISIRETQIANKRSFKQDQHLFYAEYTRRYQSFVMGVPDDVYFGNASVTSNSLKYVQVYFDLCNEEYLLYQRGLIDDVVWKTWKEGMAFTIRTAKGDLYLKCWKKLKEHDYYNEEFVVFFEDEILKIN